MADVRLNRAKVLKAIEEAAQGAKDRLESEAQRLKDEVNLVADAIEQGHVNGKITDAAAVSVRDGFIQHHSPRVHLMLDGGYSFGGNADQLALKPGRYRAVVAFFKLPDEDAR